MQRHWGESIKDLCEEEGRPVQGETEAKAFWATKSLLAFTLKEPNELTALSCSVDRFQ